MSGLQKIMSGPDLNPTEHIYHKVEQWLYARPSCKTSVPNKTHSHILMDVFVTARG